MRQGQQQGFSLIEAMVALVLFSVFFIGATTLLANYETENANAEERRLIQDLGSSFLIDWANYSRQQDIMNTNGIRPTNSVLDDFDDFDFLGTETLTTHAQLTLNKVDYWQAKLKESHGVRLSKWVLDVDNSVTDGYRTLTLTVNDDFVVTWVVCC